MMTGRELENELQNLELHMMEIDAELEILIPKRDEAIKKDEETDKRNISRGILCFASTSSKYSARISELEKEKDELQAKIVARKKMLDKIQKGE